MCLQKMRVGHVLGVILLCFISFLFGKTCKKKEIIHDIEIDTVIDTIIQPVPVPQYIVDVGEVEIPFPMDAIVEKDTIKDTVYINIPIQRKTYNTDDYRAVISGYRPNLDTMIIYHKKRNNIRKEPALGHRAGGGVWGWARGLLPLLRRCGLLSDMVIITSPFI